MMATTYTDAQQLWPLSGQRLNCSSIIGTPIVANTTNSRVCGVQTNRTIAEYCCGSAEVQEYQCWLYCESTQSMDDWARCTSGNSTFPVGGPFCQGELIANSTETLTSSAFRSSAPRYSWIVFVLVFTFLFVGPAQATVIPTLDTSLVKRQSDSGCSLAIESNYTSLRHSSRVVSARFSCNRASTFCSYEAQVDTSITGNNRTLNGSSAAEPGFDAFFDAVSNSTNGRKFPALSSANFTRGFVAYPGQTVALSWTPISVRSFQSHVTLRHC
jgi:hypothetical protein